MVTATRERKPAMTAEQAIRFERYSPINALSVRVSLKCGCMPYEDVFTFRRWIAQGYCVRRGEHSISLPVVKHVETENEDTGETEMRKVFASAHVFCRHQVEKLTPKA